MLPALLSAVALAFVAPPAAASSPLPAPGGGQPVSLAGSPIISEVVVMNRTEELADDLANAMIDMAEAFCRGDDEKVLESLAEDFEGELPPAAPPAVTVPHEGFSRLDYPASPARSVSRDEWTREMRSWVRDWRLIDDTRIGVKHTGLDRETGQLGPTQLKMLIQGVGPGGDRRAVTAVIRTEAVTAAGGWVWNRARLQSREELRGSGSPFTEVTRSAGLRVSHSSGEARRRMRGPESLGQGGAVLDIDSDGLLDLFVPSRPANQLFRNKGDGTFEDVAAEWGVAQPAGGSGAIALDYDNDGRPDLFKCYANYEGIFQRGRLTLWRNAGNRFEDVSAFAGIDREVIASSATAADYDGDGLLDIYVCCIEDGERVSGKPSFIHATNATPNLLFHNLGNGRFEEVGAAAGVADTRWTQAAMWADYDGDGRPDLFVVNDRGDKGLFHNEGDGTFRDLAPQYGILDSGSGMGGDWGDYDGDGLLDVYISNMGSTAGARILRRIYPEGPDHDEAPLVKFASGNTLFRWDGSGFTDVTKEVGVGPAEWAWGNSFLDIDNDGWLDIFVTNGNKTGKSKKET